MNNDIVDTLRRNALYIPTSRINSFGRPQMGFELTSFNLIAADEIERLREERDEARILACKGLALEARHTMDKIGSNIWKKTALTPQEMAEERGWDCFKENTNE